MHLQRKMRIYQNFEHETQKAREDAMSQAKLVQHTHDDFGKIIVGERGSLPEVKDEKTPLAE